MILRPLPLLVWICLSACTAASSGGGQDARLDAAPDGEADVADHGTIDVAPDSSDADAATVYPDGAPTFGDCEPGDVVCKDLSAAWVCTEHKTWVSFPCIEGATCQGGVCRMCAPDELQCLSFSTYKSCASDGRSWGGYETCDEGLSCVGGACRDCKMIQACDSLSSLETACIDDEGQKIYSESLDCQDDQICKNATCIYSGCVPSALLVIDRSSSMEYHWDTVRDSVAQWVEANPGVRFGLYTFPGEMSCTVPDDVVVPFTQGDAGPFNDFFNQWGILSTTPLLDAMEKLETLAPATFGPAGGVMVLLADGEDTCFYDFGLPSLLAQTTEKLYKDHAIQTYVIGYDFGSPLTPLDGQLQLNAVAGFGGTNYQTYIPAGNAQELNEAFGTITVDWKLCLGEQ
jgi:hypothetical protein